MTCEDFERLWDHAKGVCQICGRRGEDTAHRVLCIDHDPFTGPWAVRGILCGRCNAALHLPCLDSQKVASYMADPWWLHMLSAYGVQPEGIPEPGLGALVGAARRLTWRHAQDGWRCQEKRHRASCRTWASLNRQYGPHRLRILTGQLTLPFGT